MSANPGPNPDAPMPSWVTNKQLEDMKAINASMKNTGPGLRPGRGRGSAPSPALTRGRGLNLAYGRPIPSTRPTPSPALSASAYNSTTSSRTTPAPGAVKSGAMNPHSHSYSVGPSTAPPAFKPVPRQRAVSPVRAPATVPATKPKSPSKLRNSILVMGSAPRLVSPEALAMAAALQHDPRFIAVQSSLPDVGPEPITANNWTKDDPTKPIIPGHMRKGAETAMKELADCMGLSVEEISSDGVSFGTGLGPSGYGIQASMYAPGNPRGAKTLPNHQADVNGSDRKFAATNRKAASARVTSGDGDVEMIDSPANTKLSAPQGPVNWDDLPKLSASKYATPSAFSNSAHGAPKSALAFNNDAYSSGKPAPQGPVNWDDLPKSSASKYTTPSAFSNSAHGTPKSAPTFNNDAYSGGKPAPQGPVNWDDLPKLSASKYATPSAFSNSAHGAPKSAQAFNNDAYAGGKPAPTFGHEASSAPNQAPAFKNVNENLKPAQQVQILSFADISRNIAADMAKGLGKGAAGQPSSDPFASNNVSTSNQASAGSSAAALDSAIDPFQANSGHATPNLNVFGAPSAPLAWGSVDYSAPKVQTSSGFVQPVAQAQAPQNVSARPAWGSINHSASNSQAGVINAQAAAPAWGSFNHSAPKVQTGSGFVQPVAQAQATQNVSNFAAPSARPEWGSINHSASNGQAGVINAQAAAPAWGSFNHSAPKVQTGSGFVQPVTQAQATQNVSNFAAPSARHEWGSINHSASNGQAGISNVQAAAPAWGSVYHSAPTGQVSFGAAPYVAPAGNALGSGGQGGLDATQIAQNIANELRAMVLQKPAVKQPSYEAAPLGPPAVASGTSNVVQGGSAPPFQVVPGPPKVAGLPGSRRA